MTDTVEVARAFESLVQAQATLEQLGVIRSQRIVPDFGEWFGCRLLGVEMCGSRTQKGWDIGNPRRRIQVKTHAKAETNSARRTTIRKDELGFDELLVLVLSPQYKVKNMYLVPRADVERLAPLQGDKRIVSWSQLEPYSVRGVPAELRPLLSESSAHDV